MNSGAASLNAFQALRALQILPQGPGVPRKSYGIEEAQEQGDLGLARGGAAALDYSDFLSFGKTPRCYAGT